MGYISFFLVISAFCYLATPATAQLAAKINQTLKIIEDEALDSGSADTTKPNIKVNPGMIYNPNGKICKRKKEGTF
jgi:hypothetical protein